MNQFEENIRTNYEDVDALLEAGYLFYNWKTKQFENVFFCEEHINEDFRADWNNIHDVATQNEALIATVIETAPLIIQEGVHYCNRYGYIVYKGDKLQEEYYI